MNLLRVGGIFKFQRCQELLRNSGKSSHMILAQFLLYLDIILSSITTLYLQVNGCKAMTLLQSHDSKIKSI